MNMHELEGFSPKTPTEMMLYNKLRMACDLLDKNAAMVPYAGNDVTLDFNHPEFLRVANAKVEDKGRGMELTVNAYSNDYDGKLEFSTYISKEAIDRWDAATYLVEIHKSCVHKIAEMLSD